MRTFIAVEIDQAVRQRTAGLIERLRPLSGGVSWVGPDKLHFTLKFLGDVDQRQIPEVCQAVETAAAGFGPFEIAVQGVGAFPRVNRPSVIWLGASDGTDRMTELAERVEMAMKRLGFPRESRPFKAHLTLGRVRRPGPQMTELAEALKQNASFEAGRCTVAEVVVFSSQLHPSGAIYTALCRASLE